MCFAVLGGASSDVETRKQMSASSVSEAQRSAARDVSDDGRAGAAGAVPAARLPLPGTAV